MNAILHGMMDAIVSSIVQSLSIFMIQYHNMIVCEQCFYDCQLVQNYSEIGHGNVAVDGVGALWKREIQKKIKPNARQLQFVFDVMTFF